MALEAAGIRISTRDGFESGGRTFDWAHLYISFTQADPDCAVVVDVEVPIDSDENRTKRQNIEDAKAAASEVLKAALAALGAA